jgi:predicted kinase
MLGNARDRSSQEAVWIEANRRTQEALSGGQGVVLDATFLERWKRKDMLDFLRAQGATKIIGVIFDIPATVARERNAARDRVVLEDVMQWMEGRLAEEPPQLEEGFDALCTMQEFEKIGPALLND